MNEQHFTTVIKPKSGWFDLHLKEVFAYRDLIFLFVKRNFVSKYCLLYTSDAADEL